MVGGVEWLELLENLVCWSCWTDAMVILDVVDLIQKKPHNDHVEIDRGDLDGG